MFLKLLFAVLQYYFKRFSKVICLHIYIKKCPCHIINYYYYVKTQFLENCVKPFEDFHSCKHIKYYNVNRRRSAR